MLFHTLIVDDDTSFAKLVEIRLRAWRKEMQVTQSQTLAEARTILDSSNVPFTLVILDQNLPDGRGFELFEHPALKDSTVLAVSADDSPELPGETVRAGAQHFLGKRQVAAPLFIPLIEALLERKALERRLKESEINEARIKSVRTLTATLRHEINNPLGAVLGAAYLIRSQGQLDQSQAEALKLIESSGKRINHVLQQLCDTVELETVNKANETVYHVPGDAPWEKS